MADLTDIINTSSPDKVIDLYYESTYKPRKYLGLSEIGHACSRYLWYVYHGYLKKAPEGRILRLFQLGKIIEDQIVFDLIACGYEIFHVQNEVVFTDGDYKLLGHIDGKIKNLTESSKVHLLEIKSANDKAFKDLSKKRSYELWQLKYKSQIHVYMLGLKLTRCLVVVYNKNTSELYTERIKLDREYAVNKLVDVFNAIKMKTPPERNCPRQDWYEAKWCDFNEECWKG